MRKSMTGIVVEGENEDLLTTGEAAKVLGTSRQHIVDLCTQGNLPFVTVGRHRRITRHDLEAMRTRTRRLSRDQLRSLWLSHAVAGEIVRNPKVTLDKARANVSRMLTSSARGSARVWITRWQKLLDGPIEDVLEALTSKSPLSRELRQNSPFAGILDDADRGTILNNFALVTHEKKAK